MRRLVARQLLLLAKELLAEDKEYIYDPEHKKKPKGRYEKTERGWSLKRDKKKKKDKNFLEKSRSASRTDTPVEVLNYLSTDENPRIRARVANNPNTPKDILLRLSKDKRRIVRAAVARNKKTPQKVLRELCDDPSYLVKRECSNNLKTPMGCLKKIFQNKKKDNPNAAKIVKSEAKKMIKKRLPKFNPNTNSDLLKKSCHKLGEEEEEVLESLGQFKRTLGPRGQGRNEIQLKQDFINHMSPLSYESQESFQRAKNRVEKMSVSDFAIMLNSILLDDEEENA